MTTLERVNSRGLAAGWHAEQLRDKAQRLGRTMAEEFRLSIANSAAFNVPAKAVQATSAWITYRFLDGSQDRYPNQKH